MRKAVAAALSVGAVVLVGAGAASVIASRASAAEVSYVESVVVDGIAAGQTSFVIPGYARQAASLGPGSHMASEALVTRPDRSSVEATSATGESLLRKYYSGAALSKWLQIHHRMMDEQGAQVDDGFHPLGGGVSDANFTRVDVEGDVAAVEGFVTTWAKMAQIGPNGDVEVDQPSNTLAVTIKLEKSSGTWRIASYDWAFAPGSEP